MSETPIPPTRVQRWRKHLESCRRSGLTMSAYAERNGLPLSGLYRWNSRLKICSSTTARKADLPAFDGKECPVVPGSQERRPSVAHKPVTLVPVATEQLFSEGEPTLSVILQDRFRIDIRSDFSPDLLLRVVTTLEKVR